MHPTDWPPSLHIPPHRSLNLPQSLSAPAESSRLRDMQTLCMAREARSREAPSLIPDHPILRTTRCAKQTPTPLRKVFDERSSVEKSHNWVNVFSATFKDKTLHPFLAGIS